MAKYSRYNPNQKKDNRFRNFVIGIFGAIVLLSIGLIIINAVSPNPLSEANIYKYATDVYGERNDEEYLIYFYSETCTYCQQLNNSTQYKNYISDPEIPLYKIDVLKVPDNILRKANITGTPAIVHMKKNEKGKYEVVRTVVSLDSIINYLERLG